MNNFILISFLILANGSLFCQSTKPEIISTSGDYFKTTDVSLSWTLGESVSETFSSSNLILTQGFQQSHYLITSIDDIASDAFKIKVFPNPATDLINIEITSLTDSNAYYIKLLDLEGRELFSTKMNADKDHINMSLYPTGIYILNVSDNNMRPLQNFKIQKIK